MSRIDYREAVLFRKKEYNRNGWNELVIKASDLIALCDEKDVHAVCEGMLKNMLNAYISMIDSAENLAKASQAVTEEMDNLMRTGSALTDTANAAYDSAIDQAGTVSDLVTNSINQMIGSIMSLQNTVNAAVTGMISARVSVGTRNRKI